jgi:hypothetical protein
MKLLLNLSLFVGLSGSTLLAAAPSAHLHSHSPITAQKVSQLPYPNPGKPGFPCLRAQLPYPNPGKPGFPC